MMGEVGFVALGVDWTQARVTHNWSLRLNTECTPLERHAVLYFIEQGLMTKTGKRYEWEVGVGVGHPAAGDDSGLRLGRRGAARRSWAGSGTSRRSATGSRRWRTATSAGRASSATGPTVRDQGLTQHENWWPEIYRQACATWGTEPDPKVLAYAETYEAKRADLQTVATSG